MPVPPPSKLAPPLSSPARAHLSPCEHPAEALVFVRLPSLHGGERPLQLLVDRIGGEERLLRRQHRTAACRTVRANGCRQRAAVRWWPPFHGARHCPSSRPSPPPHPLPALSPTTTATATTTTLTNTRTHTSDPHPRCSPLPARAMPCGTTRPVQRRGAAQPRSTLSRRSADTRHRRQTRSVRHTARAHARVRARAGGPVPKPMAKTRGSYGNRARSEQMHFDETPASY